MILLINPKTTKPTELQSEFFREPSLGILYLAAVLDNYGLDVDILDLEQYPELDEDSLRDVIIEKITNNQIIGITSLTNNFKFVLKIVNIIKNQNNNKKIVLGGPHVSFLYKNILQSNKNVDFICIGEAEKSFLQLSNILIEDNDQQCESKIQKIKGLAYIDSKGELIFTGYPDPIEIETLPLPARYKLENTARYYKVANIIVNRGCPYQCSFCSRQNLFRNVRVRSIDSILSEIIDILSYQNYNYVNFYDNININRVFFEDFLNMFISNKITIPWGCELRVDNITDKEASLLKNAGCRLVATGIESASINVLKQNLKFQNPKNVLKGIRNLKKYKIPIQAYFVLGLPGETEESFYETIEFIKKIPFDRSDKINYFVATPYPGSQLWEQKEKFNLNIIEYDFSKYDCQHIIYETLDLNKEILESLLLDAKAIELYYQ
ncbi:MAG: B12-binding domain-containing radical SAM protein [Candidatus Hermodarchaeota archaeon]